MITTHNGMFITNNPNDVIIKGAMESYMRQLEQEQEYRMAIRAGKIIPTEITTWNISDRD